MKWRLFAVAATAILPALVSLAYNEISLRQSYRADTYAQVTAGNRATVFETEQIIDGIASVLYAVSAMKSVTNHDIPSCNASLKTLADENLAIETIVVIDSDGKVVCDSREVQERTDYAGERYFRLALSGNHRAVGEYFKDPATGLAEIPIAVPVRDREGRAIGVIAATVRIDWFDARIRERGVAEGAALTIADRNGYIIAREPFPERFVGTRIPDAFLKLVASDTPGTMDVTSQDGTERILAYQPANATALGLYISSGVSKQLAFSTVNRVSVSSVAAIAASIALGLAAAWFVGQRWIYQPIRRILNTVEAWRGGAFDVRTGFPARTGDIAEIGHALDELLHEIGRQREASARADAHRDLLMQELGHRVKNTLAISISIANQMFRDSHQQTGVFAKRLSALAGAYDLLLKDDWNSADLKAVVAKSLEPHLHAKSQLRASGPDVALPSQLVLSLSLALHELATNAVKYGALSTETGYIDLTWHRQGETGTTVQMHWREHDGPPVVAPTRQGFGSKLLSRVFDSTAKSNMAFDYAPEGLHCRIEFQIPETPGPSPALPVVTAGVSG